MRWAAAAVVAVVVSGAPAVAHADPAGPTDYSTEIVGVRPAEALDVVSVAIVGGDAFIEVVADAGHEVVVLGYAPDEEPYLRIRTDGGVEQNVRSYATYYNAARYGTEAVPDIVDTHAAPEWEQIGDGGAWAWHDHRAHWMSEEPPIGLDRGESLPSSVVPLLVDGERVDVEVVTTYLPSPSAWPSLVGALIGVQLVLIAVWIGRATGILAAVMLAGSALVAGSAQFWSVPSSTGPLLTWWLMPALALLAAVIVVATYGRSAWLELGLTAFAALQLGVWAWLRRDHLTAAYLPTSLPMGLDRAITSAVLTGSVVLLIGTGRLIWRQGVPAATANG